MNALQPALSVDTRTHTQSGMTTHLALSMAGPCLELTLPTGWLLRGGTGCQLTVIRGCLWLTDSRGQDFWLKEGDSNWLSGRTLLTAECDTVVQLSPGTSDNHFWQPRLVVNAKRHGMQLQLSSLSFWQRCLNVFARL